MSSWSADMRRLKRLTDAKMTKVYRVAIMETSKDIIMDTPVDTGRLRGNWQMGVNHKTNGQLEVTDKSGGVTVSRISAIIAPLSREDTAVFYNNLIYSVPIEYGHSRVKAPQGMVRKNIANWDQRVNRIARVVARET